MMKQSLTVVEGSIKYVLSIQLIEITLEAKECLPVSERKHFLLRIF